MPRAVNPLPLLLMSVLTGAAQPAPTASFAEELAFLRQHTEVVLLEGSGGRAQVAIAPAWQGRVMTSTARGAAGASFGWINRELIASGKVQPHINVYGGEDRFWLGPEGGQYSIFFAPGSKFDLEHWFVPPALDTEPFDVIHRTGSKAVFGRTLQVTNYTGTVFRVGVQREVRLLSAKEALEPFGVRPPAGVEAVVYESVNTVKNEGDRDWTESGGLLSIWMLGMFNASPEATVVIPFRQGPEQRLGPVVNDSYFGRVPADRLVVRDDVLFFRADAQHRSKIGLSPRRVRPVLGSYDAAQQALTLVTFRRPRGATRYVNSMWQIQERPYDGDVVNSYNDGPATPGGTQLGRFYELETSSPALALRAGRSARHVHRTAHFTGPELELDRIARAALGVGLAEVKAAFRR